MSAPVVKPIGRIGISARVTRLARSKVCARSTDTPRMTPLFGAGPYFNLHHNIVHAVRSGDVDMTMVDGRVVVEGGQLRTADRGALIAAIHRLAPPHFARRAALTRRARAWLRAMDR